MKTTVDFYDFKTAFEKADRAEQFSTEGLIALFDWIEQYEEDTDTEIELDVIALCCDFTEYADLEEVQDNYTDIKSLSDLENHTLVIPFKDGIIIQNF